HRQFQRRSAFSPVEKALKSEAGASWKYGRRRLIWSGQVESLIRPEWRCARLPTATEAKPSAMPGARELRPSEAAASIASTLPPEKDRARRHSHQSARLGSSEERLARGVRCGIQREPASSAEGRDFAARSEFLLSAAAAALVRIRKWSGKVSPPQFAFRTRARFREFVEQDPQMRRREMALQFLPPRSGIGLPLRSFAQRDPTSLTPARARSPRFPVVARKVRRR